MFFVNETGPDGFSGTNSSNTSFTVQSGISPADNSMTPPPPSVVSKPQNTHHHHGHHQQQQQQQPTVEVHDAQLKVPLSIPLQSVLPTAGLDWTLQQQSSGGRAKLSARRVCEMFLSHGNCMNGTGCPDLHIEGPVWQDARDQAMKWIEDKAKEFAAVASNQSVTFRVYCADIKEIIDVPATVLSFTRGLYLDPACRAKRSHPTHRPSPFAVLTSQVPTACGLFSHDPSQCKWGEWCNQAHIDGRWMAERRVEFEQWSHELEGQFQRLPRDHIFPVHDPENKTTIPVPKSLMAEFSRGLFQGSQSKAPSVCMLYQRGRCTAGPCCNQVHIPPSTLFEIRNAVANGLDASSVAPSPASGGATTALETLPAYESRHTVMMPIDGDGLVEPSPKPGLRRGVGLGSPAAVTPPTEPDRSLNPMARPFVPPTSPPVENVPPHPVEDSPLAKTTATAVTMAPAPMDGDLLETPAGPATVPLRASPNPTTTQTRGMHRVNTSDWDVSKDDVFSPGDGSRRTVASPVRVLPKSEMNVIGAGLHLGHSPLSPNACRTVFGGAFPPYRNPSSSDTTSSENSTPMKARKVRSQMSIDGLDDILGSGLTADVLGR